MSVLLDRRSAGEFAAALERGDRTASPALAPLLDVVESLRPLGAAATGPDPEFRDAVRARLLAVAAVSPGGEVSAEGADGAVSADGADAAPRPAKQPALTPWRRRIVAAAAAVTLVAGSAGGLAVASTGALPGDTLYGVKRTVEDLRLSLARGDEARGAQYLRLADTRMNEVEGLLARADGRAPDAGAVSELDSTLADMGAATERGSSLLTTAYERSGDTGPLRRLGDFARDERGRVEAIELTLPPQLRGRHAEVLALLNRIDAQVTLLGGTEGKPGGTPGSRRGTGPGSGSAPAGTGPPGTTTAPANPSSNPSAGLPGGGKGSAPVSPGLPLPDPEVSAGPTSGGPLPLPTGTGAPLPDTSADVTVPPVLPSPQVSTEVSVPPLLPSLPDGDLGIGGGQPGP